MQGECQKRNTIDLIKTQLLLFINFHSSILLLFTSGVKLVEVTGPNPKSSAWLCWMGISTAVISVGPKVMLRMSKKKWRKKWDIKKFAIFLLTLVVYVALNIHQSNTLPSLPACKEEDAGLPEASLRPPGQDGFYSWVVRRIFIQVTKKEMTLE